MTTSVHAAQEKLTPSEIEEGRHYLEQAEENVFSAIQSLSEAQCKYRPAAGGWSIAENVEHIVIIQERVLGPIGEALAQSPETQSSHSEIIESIIKTKFADRSRKFKAPEFVQPTGQWTIPESLNRLSENTQRLKERLENARGLRLHRIPSPPLNAVTEGTYTLMDGYQWILTVAAHTERHTNQILEVKGEPNFPANGRPCAT